MEKMNVVWNGGRTSTEGVTQGFIQLCRSQSNLNITKYLRENRLNKGFIAANPNMFSNSQELLTVKLN